jgi:hypothetical protein
VSGTVFSNVLGECIASPYQTAQFFLQDDNMGLNSLLKRAFNNNNNNNVNLTLD